MKTLTFSKALLCSLLLSTLSAQDASLQPSTNPSNSNMGASLQSIDVPNTTAMEEFKSGNFSAGKFYTKEPVLLDSMTKEELSLKSSPTGPKKQRARQENTKEDKDLNVSNALLDRAEHKMQDSANSMQVDSRQIDSKLEDSKMQDSKLVKGSPAMESSLATKKVSTKQDLMTQDSKKEPMLHDKSFGMQEVKDLYPVSTTKERLDYAACSDYYHQASIRLDDGTYAVYIKGKGFVGFSKTRPKDVRVEKYDPFSGLFLLKDSLKTPLGYTLMDIDNYARSRELVSADIKGARGVRLLKGQAGFLDYGRIKGQIGQNGVLSNICYQIYGIGVGGNSFIEKSYIMRFLDSKGVHYGDIGVRFKETDPKSATFEVLYVDPFFKSNPFMQGDVLISVNNIAPKSFKDLSEMLLNLKEGSLAKVDIRRDGKVLSFEVKAGKRYGGLLLPDSFLERFHLRLSDSFTVLDAPSSGRFSELKKGDKILKIDGLDLKDYLASMYTNRDKTLRELFTKLYMMKIKASTKVQIPSKTKEDELASYIQEFANKHSSKEDIKAKASKDSMQGSGGTKVSSLKSGDDLEAFLNMNSPKINSESSSINIIKDDTKTSKQENANKTPSFENLDMLISRDGFEFRLIVK
ncbi:PDZ domain-containing protein [Helicobacter sp. 11S02629-2]|uniref:DUF7488 domain-containing protein n=1 Tax=Helicobacter sp. 11S02629-2 TaxID=1476195 RepID=UPI000BA6645B|nr:PDZ domain-containing protein [Helicobacter sp. 11S02629-2]PAF45404.1 hypothetical protein BKH40_02750 [Helicobacter sp. 11S02629-2]